MEPSCTACINSQRQLKTNRLTEIPNPPPHELRHQLPDNPTRPDGSQVWAKSIPLQQPAGETMNPSRVATSPDLPPEDGGSDRRAPTAHWLRRRAADSPKNSRRWPGPVAAARVSVGSRSTCTGGRRWAESERGRAGAPAAAGLTSAAGRSRRPQARRLRTAPRLYRNVLKAGTGSSETLSALLCRSGLSGQARWSG